MCGCGCGCTCSGRKGTHENGGWAEGWNEKDDALRRARFPVWGISPKVRNSESAFSSPAQRAARGRRLRTDSLRRPPAPRGILFPSAPSAKLVLGLPHFPTSSSIFTLAGTPSLRRREHASGVPVAFGPVCVSTICGLVGFSRSEAGGPDARREHGGFEAGWRSRVKTLGAPAQLVVGMRPPYPCAAHGRCADHSFFGLSQYRSRKRERGRGDVVVGYRAFLSIVLVAYAASAVRIGIEVVFAPGIYFGTCLPGLKLGLFEHHDGPLVFHPSCA
ncbi:hypothetical protein DFH09DRAFT_1181371 [Mycena vulgaris]|nr:hypothetical protein DFH09DRAFT_1181371 [Mycena vulgaris]